MTTKSNAIRFCIGPWKGRYSSVWRIWSNQGSDDIYLGVRSLLRQMKISLHRSGKFRVAFEKSYHKQMINKGANPDADRAVLKWEKPPVGELEIMQVLDIHFPLSALSLGWAPKGDKGKELLLVQPHEPSIGENDTITAKIIFHRTHPESKIFNKALRKRNIMPICHAELTTGEFSSVVFTYSKLLPIDLKKEDTAKYGVMFKAMFASSNKKLGDTIRGKTFQHFKGGTPPSIINIGGMSITWATEKHFTVDFDTPEKRAPA